MQKHVLYTFVLLFIGILSPALCQAAASDENTMPIGSTNYVTKIPGPAPFLLEDSSSDSSLYDAVLKKIQDEDYAAVTSPEILDLVTLATRYGDNAARYALKNIRDNYWAVIHTKNSIILALNDLSESELKILVAAANRGGFRQMQPILLGEIVYIAQSDTSPEDISYPVFITLVTALKGAIDQHILYSLAYDGSSSTHSSQEDTYVTLPQMTPQVTTPPRVQQSEQLSAHDLERYWAARAELTDVYGDASLSPTKITATLNTARIINLLTDALLDDPVAIRLVADIKHDDWQRDLNKLLSFLVKIIGSAPDLNRLITIAKQGELTNVKSVDMANLVGLATLPIMLDNPLTPVIKTLEAALNYTLRYNLLHNPTYRLLAQDPAYKHALQELNAKLNTYEKSRKIKP